MAFRDIVGHRRLVDLLSRSIERGTLPPSLILAGPSGVGKRLVAIAAAQALNCGGVRRGSDPRLDACGTCASCTRIARGVHADVIVIEPGDGGSIKIDRVREVIERAGYRPFEGRWRVVVFDEADSLVPAAQNALLKTLEEPPSASIFLLVTSRPDTLLPTVRSRCPRLQFRPLTADEVAAALVARGLSVTEAHAVAATADGSLGRALEASAGDLVEAREAAVRVLLLASAGDDRRRLEGAKELLPKTSGGGATDRAYLAAHLRAMASLVRDIEVLGAGAGDSVLANPDVRPALERLSAYRGERGVHAFAALDQGLAALDRNAGSKLVADWVTLHL